MHYREGSKSQMRGRLVGSLSLVFSEMSQFGEKTGPFTGIL